MSTAALSFSDSELAAVLHYARQVENDADRDQYFRAVADALRGIPNFNAEDVSNVSGAAFLAFAICEGAA